MIRLPSDDWVKNKKTNNAATAVNCKLQASNTAGRLSRVCSLSLILFLIESYLQLQFTASSKVKDGVLYEWCQLLMHVIEATIRPLNSHCFTVRLTVFGQISRSHCHTLKSHCFCTFLTVACSKSHCFAL